MAQPPHYPADRFPGDFIASVIAAVAMALISGAAVWYASLLYLRRTYPGHGELEPAAAVSGCVDGALLGLGAFVATFAVRIWRSERAERKQSDALLRLALEDVERARRDGEV